MNDNMERWLTELETTDKAQGREFLCRIDTLPNGHEEEQFCCLGIGAQLAGLPDHTDDSVVYFDGLSDLAPRSFVAWLGLPLPEEDLLGRYDLQLRVDENLYPIRLVDEDGVEVTGSSRPYSAASLNDSGCTFAQIAQMIRYFGVDPVAV